MTISQMRAYVSKQYASKRWRNRVDNMPEDQLIAIYHAMLKRNKKVEEPNEKQLEFSFHYDQIFIK
jgi:hypothetical protein